MGFREIEMALLPIRKATVDRRPTHPCPGLACGHRYRIRFSSVFCLAAACCLLLTGCGNLAYRLDRRPPAQFIPNPIETPALNDQFVWSQVVDTVDDYFRVATEQPVQNSANYVLDGRLETTYQVGSSIFEPWRKDSTSGFEAMQSTLQSIRRKATVIVRPTGAAYSIEVIVQKDLEDTDRTQYATETTATRRHDGTVVRPVGGPDDVPQTLGWISLGRDSSLEQRILRDIFNRLTKQDR